MLFFKTKRTPNISPIMISGPANNKHCNTFYSEWYPDVELHRQHEQTKNYDAEDRSASDTVISSAGNVRLCEKRDGLNMTTWYLVKQFQKYVRQDVPPLEQNDDRHILGVLMCKTR